MGRISTSPRPFWETRRRAMSRLFCNHSRHSWIWVTPARATASSSFFLARVTLNEFADRLKLHDADELSRSARPRAGGKSVRHTRSLPQSGPMLDTGTCFALSL